VGVGAANRANAARLAPRSPNAPPPSWLRSRLEKWYKVDENTPLIVHDQISRLQCMIWAGLVFVVLGLAVNFNRTSLHNFYRDRLAEAYLEPGPGGGTAARLSDLDNSKLGGPYHLLVATLNLLGYRRSPEKTWPFLFSRLYCGSDVTRYLRTDDPLWGGFNDLSAATAISGAAVSPVQLESPQLGLLMLLANSRLGQWLPNPRNWRPWGWLLGWPNALGLFLESLRDAEDRRLCFVTDGGHSENLGLGPLMERKCRLIFVSDAEEDVGHSFPSFSSSSAADSGCITGFGSST
jgi:hypothetical protein